MKSSVAEIPTILGTAMGGGFYAGRYQANVKTFAIIVPSKAESRHDPMCWNTNYKSVEGALSVHDSMANTLSMAAAGSPLAQFALDFRAGGQDDWCVAAQDVAEIVYRNLKPTTDTNSLYMRSGINLSAIVPTPPYTPDFPAQTLAEAFQQGGSEAFDADAYWTSTQSASYAGYAWCQHFYSGLQITNSKYRKLSGVLVRSLEI
jgi:hypothetical protein